MRATWVFLFAVMSGCGGDDGGSAGVDAASGDDAPPTDGSSDQDGGGAIEGSAGCGVATTNTPATFVKRTINQRDLFVRTPTNYDPSRPYPVIYQLHGCSSQPTRETNNVPVENQVGDNAIVVRGRAAANCWDTNPNGPDVPYIDAMMADVEGAFCVDTSRRFLAGYSSGSFMSHALGCIRGDKLRGVMSIAGGQGGSNCTGHPAALLIHDDTDTTVNISASITARDNYLQRNTCSTPPTSTPTDQAPCVEYAGCAADKPVVWCQTTGQNHSRQDQLAAPIFWSFTQSLL